jgi:bifunctional non-homologous end joining protein LigD
MVRAMRRCGSPGLSSLRSDPTPGAGFQKVRKAALIVRDALAERKIVSYPKTTGPRGIHVYVPIARGPVQKQVWTFAKSVAKELEAKQSDNYRRISGRETARKPSPCGLQPECMGTHSGVGLFSPAEAPRHRIRTVSWREVDDGIEIDEFRLDTCRRA